METSALRQPVANSSVPWSVWLGRVLSGIVVLGTVASAAMKFTHGPEIVQNFGSHLGFPESALTPIGVLELVCTALYAFPKTRVLGALMLTAYLGGATASHVRVGDPFIAPVILGIMVWAGLFFRDASMRSLIPLTQK